MTDEQLTQLDSGSLYLFADWPNSEVPNDVAGVYTVWDRADLLYVGMAGRGMVADAPPEDFVSSATRRKGLRSRLNSHASGRRSGDQFCIDVFDRLVLPNLTPSEIAGVKAGNLSSDGRTRAYIHEHLSYRFTLTSDGKAALKLEREVQIGGLGQCPRLNPR